MLEVLHRRPTGAAIVSVGLRALSAPLAERQILDNKKTVEVQVARAAWLAKEHSVLREPGDGLAVYWTNWVSVGLRDMPLEVSLAGVYQSRWGGLAENHVYTQMFMKCSSSNVPESGYQYSVLFSKEDTAVYIPAPGQEGASPYHGQRVEPLTPDWQDIDVLMSRLCETSFT